MIDADMRPEGAARVTPRDAEPRAAPSRRDPARDIGASGPLSGQRRTIPLPGRGTEPDGPSG